MAGSIVEESAWGSSCCSIYTSHLIPFHCLLIAILVLLVHSIASIAANLAQKPSLPLAPRCGPSPEHGDLGSPSSHPDSTAQQFTDSEGYQAPPLTASSNTGWPRKIRQCIPTKTEGALPLTLCTFRRDQTICNGPYEPLMYFPQAFPVSDTFVSSHSRYAPLLRARWLQKNHRFAT